MGPDQIAKSDTVPVRAEQPRRLVVLPQEVRGQTRPLQQLRVLQRLRGVPAPAPAAAAIHPSRKVISRKNVLHSSAIAAVAAAAAGTSACCRTSTLQRGGGWVTHSDGCRGAGKLLFSPAASVASLPDTALNLASYSHTERP